MEWDSDIEDNVGPIAWSPSMEAAALQAEEKFSKCELQPADLVLTR